MADGREMDDAVSEHLGAAPGSGEDYDRPKMLARRRAALVVAAETRGSAGGEKGAP